LRGFKKLIRNDLSNVTVDKRRENGVTEQIPIYEYKYRRKYNREKSSRACGRRSRGVTKLRVQTLRKAREEAGSMILTEPQALLFTHTNKKKIN
jgi:hypothetical protein